MKARFSSLVVALAGASALVWGCSLANAPDDVHAASSSGDLGAGGATSSSSSSSSGNASSSSSSSSGAGGSDPCAAVTCDPNAACAGGTCACKPGFTGNGKTCTDVDECADPKSCDMNASCANTPGSFTCTCLAGTMGDGKTCTDIDECATPGACDPNATCANTPGAFTCACNPGYMGDGMSCVLITKFTNGLGGFYTTLSMDRTLNAQLACESIWGAGQCATDGCGSCDARGYHKAGSPACNGSTYWNFFDLDEGLSCNWIDPNEILISPDNQNWIQ